MGSAEPGPSDDWLYGGSYPDDDLAWWPTGSAREGSGREVCGYFNNDGSGNAVRNARRLRELLKS